MPFRPGRRRPNLENPAARYGLAVGFFKNVDDLRKNWAVDRSWKPKMPGKKRAELYRLWKKAVTRSFDWAEEDPGEFGVFGLALPESWGGAAAGAAAVTKITEWDYQSADPEKTQWQKVLDECTASTGIAIDRQAIPRDELISKALLAAQQHQLPNVLRIDNPDLQQVADLVISSHRA